MIIDNISTDDLPDDPEAAFVEYDKRLRSVLIKAEDNDTDRYTDQNGYYSGSHEPQRFYVSSIIAFLDEYELDHNEIEDISALSNSTFSERFPEFFNRVNYLVSRYRIRHSRGQSAGIGTPIAFSPDYKSEIGSLLGTIRKIVNQEISDESKKDAIFRKIASLQSEVDRDRTTVDAVFSRMIDLSNVIGEVANNSEPLIEKLERLKKIFFEGAVKRKRLTDSSRKQALPPPDADLDDEIPF